MEIRSTDTIKVFRLDIAVTVMEARSPDTGTVCREEEEMIDDTDNEEQPVPPNKKEILGRYFLLNYKLTV